jgi:hypothetical protein
MPPKDAPTRNTDGLKKFTKARDLTLKKLGFPTFAHFTAAIRAVYDKQPEKGFDGWRKARDTALKKVGVKDYAALLELSKQKFSKLT